MKLTRKEKEMMFNQILCAVLGVFIGYLIRGIS